MKTIQLILILVISGVVCNGQKYDVWLKNNTNQRSFGKLISFDESKILIEERNKISFLLPNQITSIANFNWNSIRALTIRNESKHTAGILIGSGIGLLTGFLIVKGSKGQPGDFASPVAIPLACTLTGYLAGHLITSAKITIPITGKSPKEKSEMLSKKLSATKRNNKSFTPR